MTFLSSRKFKGLGEVTCGGRTIAETLILSPTPPGRLLGAGLRVFLKGSIARICQ